MLKAGEYSPNNPLVRCERSSGDVLLALGEYERRRNTLRRIRQQQYREYLDQQAQKKQEAKEQAERERKEREAKEREQEERERERAEEERQQREKEREQRQREQREQWERRIREERRSPERKTSVAANTHFYTNKVDTAVQVDSVTSPLSVAVQTENADLFRLPSPKCQLTQAERELSPHTVVDPSERAIHPAPWADAWNPGERRRSYGDFDERPPRKSNRDKLERDLRHSYMPSIFDADAIHLRNLQAEKDAAARRQYYQQELKNQILEQQRIREERKTREKMLEQAEMRRLEEQLRMLRVAQDREIDKQHLMDDTVKNDAIEYEKKRVDLQKEIDSEQQKLKAPFKQLPSKRIETSRSDGAKSVYYPKIQEIFQDKNRYEDIKVRKPYSSNIPDSSIFSPNYDVDSYLRKNLNFKRYDVDIESIGKVKSERVHEPKKDRIEEQSIDTLPIPILRHTPLSPKEVSNELSEAMKKVDDKWKVPAVQKNILKSMPNDEGKNVSILTQLGSIRRQLQLEQLKLDQMSKD